MMRYEEYKPTGTAWIEFIPATWEHKKISALFSQRKRKVSDTDYPALSVAKIGVVPQLANAAKSNDNENRKLVCAGDFVINSRSDRKGSCGVAQQDGSVSLINIVLTPRQEWNSRYVHYLLRSQPFSEEYYRYGRGIVSDLWTTRYSEMKNILLPVPPRKEQDQIVRYLDWQVSKINALIAAKKHEINLLEEERQALIDTFVLRSLHEKETKVSSLSWDISIPLTWNAYKFNQIFNFGKGLAITKANLLSSGTPVISYGQVHSKTNTGTSIDDSLIRYVSEDYIQSAPNSLVHEGDFIFADTSEDYQGVGNCVYVDRDDTLFAGYHTVIARPKDNKARRYLAYLFLSSAWRYSLRKQVNGVKVYSITQRILKNTCVILPPEDEQEKIVALLDEQCARIGALKQRIHEEIEHFHELRTRLISDVVTGQIDVRGIEVPDFNMVEETDSDEENLDDEDAAEETEEQEE